MTITETRTITIELLPVRALVPGLDFRLDENTDDLAELARSVAEHGVLQPLVVRDTGHELEVVAGRRRLAAARIAGLDAVPCVIRSLDDNEAADIALAENIHRRELSPVEEGLAYAHMRERGLTGQAIAQRVGRSRTHVQNLLRVIELPPEIRDKVHRREIGYMNAINRTRGESARKAKATAYTGDEAALVSYWRRRHDRLIGGLYAIQKARPVDAAECLRMIDRLIKLDARPTDGAKT